MKTVVWKHPLPDVKNHLDLTRGAKILTFAEQNGALFLWEAHDPSAAGAVARAFEVVGTGWPADVDPVRYIGTAQTRGGFVFHLFETTDLADGAA
ncbi:hypothetical protein BBK14_11100 [Parafrankia soli]|uniref:DUF7352 domain-containing protein n=1 Tax=Parafrankia soli TaxID=2599596 RepID=A0A1S1R8S8_9ACTN|nr:hypothetical protein [Parafrankia soli]OHV42161.1 hypothetical protein BBK14_11100 [Parafrankia soli]